MQGVRDLVPGRPNAGAWWPSEAVFSRHTAGLPSDADDTHGANQTVGRDTRPGREALMNSERSDPPTVGIWLLRHLYRGSAEEALTGDLIERFRDGQTRGWFFRQVLIAIAVGVRSAVCRGAVAMQFRTNPL